MQLLENIKTLNYFVPGNVNVESLPFLDPHVVEVCVAAPREELAVVVAVDGDVEHPRIGLKDVLRAIAVVHVPVQHQHPATQHTLMSNFGDMFLEVKFRWVTLITISLGLNLFPY